MNQGSLFARDYLTYAVRDTAAWKALTDDEVASIATHLKTWFGAFPKDDKTTEQRTEDDLIWKVLPRLQWSDWVRQEQLSIKGDGNKPDGLMFANAEAKIRADGRISYEKYDEGTCIVESKKWNFPLDRAGKSKTEKEAPSSQMLRYLQRLEDLTKSKLRWGVLTNGRIWRLYFKGAKSGAEGFCELDLADILGIEGHSLPLTTAEDRAHWLKVFILVFRRESFLRIDGHSSFHEISLERGKLYEESVAKDLSKVVFEDVFPELVKAVAKNDPLAPKKVTPEYLAQVKEGALILLYRLLFVLYAEDRNLLPVEDQRYDDYGLRKKVRNDIGDRIDRNDVFSDSRSSYWSQTKGLFKGIANGDKSIGLPPYNGGLFDETEMPILARVELPDDVFAKVIDSLCRVTRDGKRRYINYRDLSVQQLGSIYERLLEHEVVDSDEGLKVGLNTFARKGSGSYYTPDDLVRLIIERTVGPLVKERIAIFTAAAAKQKGKALDAFDPATAILELKICDPAMGSGHFLVDLVDYLSDEVITATVAVTEVAEGYTSPLMGRIAAIRAQIMEQANANKWAMNEDQLVDKVIVRRMVLKRVIYGVDKNPMAVELAKVALWLHSFTVGAPLSFLDHHLRCGDSLFGESVNSALNWLDSKGASLFISNPLRIARQAAKGMEIVETLTDADIAQVKKSHDEFEEVEQQIGPLQKTLSFIHALQWISDSEKEADAPILAKLRADNKARGLKDKKSFGTYESAVSSWLDSAFGDPINIASGGKPKAPEIASENYARFVKIWEVARDLSYSQNFMTWQVAFPGVWNEWESNEPDGGFDAVIGNPPWDRIKFQEVEWFAARKPEIAHADTAAKRKGLVDKLKKSGADLATQYDAAAARAAAMLRMARDGGAYPLLSGGDVNIYSLFVERALALVKPNGLVGLLTPSGIASDKTASEFFRSISTTNRLGGLLDFENKKAFFPDVDSRFKFCAIIMGGKKRSFEKADCAFYLHKTSELADPDKCFALTGKDFALVNPNTGTAPIFRNLRDAELTTAIYNRVPVLVDRSKGTAKAVVPIKYFNMFHMAADSEHFKTKTELEKFGAYSVGQNAWRKGEGEFLPLYEGKMIQAYDHRASDIVVVDGNLFRPGQGRDLTTDEHQDANRLPLPRYWIDTSNLQRKNQWAIALKDVTATTNVRTAIMAIVPHLCSGHTVAVLLSPPQDFENYIKIAPLLLGNFNSVVYDYLARQKVHTNHLMWYVLEQLPVIPPAAYTRSFGAKSAAEIVKAEVLALTYTAHDMEAFARDMGHDGAPFPWDEMDRLKRRAKLDALYFILYGITSRDDVDYIYSTFPIVEREEMAVHKRYLSRDYCLMYMNALEAGDPDAAIVVN